MIVSFATASVLNLAVAIRRQYEANMEIIAPHISSQEYLEFRAEFASVTTRSSYEAFFARLKAAAKPQEVHLRDELR